MPYSLTYNSLMHIIEVTIRDTYTISEARRAVTEVAKMANEHTCFLVLIDVRTIVLQLSTLNIYEAPQALIDIFSAYGISVYDIKRAVVISDMMPDIAFLEDVMANRGHLMKVFRTIPEAKEWLIT